MWDWPNAPALNEIFTPIPGRNYTWDGLAWTRRRASVSAGRMGDVKSGFQTADHEGWVLLDGRAVSTLTVTQQAEAAILGFTANLPNGDKCGLRQDSAAALGIVGGSQKITQANLPAINTANSGVLTSGGWDPGGINTNSAGGHRHNFRSNDPNNNNNDTTVYERDTTDGNPHGLHNNHSWFNSDKTDRYRKDAPWAHQTAGAHTHSVDLPNHTHTVPAHAHSLGGSGTDYYAKAVVANFFVFLGD